MSLRNFLFSLTLVGLAFIVYSLPVTSPADKYEGYTQFQVFFEPHDNITALTDYAKNQNGVYVYVIDYIRGQAELVVSPQRYMEVRLELESGDLDNFNIVSVNLADNIRDNLGIEPKV